MTTLLYGVCTFHMHFTHSRCLRLCIISHRKPEAMEGIDTALLIITEKWSSNVAHASNRREVWCADEHRATTITWPGASPPRPASRPQRNTGPRRCSQAPPWWSPHRSPRRGSTRVADTRPLYRSLLKLSSCLPPPPDRMKWEEKGTGVLDHLRGHLADLVGGCVDSKPLEADSQRCVGDRRKSITQCTPLLLNRESF